MALVMVESALLSGVFQVLFDRLASRQVLDFFQRKGLDQKLLSKLDALLLTVHAVLIDAEEQQITNLRVKEWVNRLEDAAYDADDLLDEINTLQCQSKASGNEVKHIPEGQMKSRLEKIVADLELLANQRDPLNLQQRVSTKPPPMLPTTSLVDESEVFGRGNDMEKLKKELLTGKAPENRIPVIAIVGNGGVGKTTLAQLLYNDSEVVREFDLRAWAYVSEEFDVLKATRTICMSFTSSFCNVGDLNFLQNKLHKKLKGKKFLLILDNIWNEKFISWDLLSSPLKDGASGSRIVVTTRNQHVADLMGAFFTHPVSHLSDDDCWLLFSRHAFRTSNYKGQLEETREKIEKKCKGLPLAAKTLGGLLRSKEEKEWDRILNSEIWDLPEDNSILPALRLSYYYLPSQLKRCFNYCSLFPKGHEFDKEKLVLMWMAEGFLPQPKEKTMEQLGREYFRELLSRSFFQKSSCNYVMHDLVNDLAQFTSGGFYCKVENGKLYGCVEKGRHFSISADNLVGNEDLVVIHDFKSLRTFFPLRVFRDRSQSSDLSKTWDTWLPFLEHLRVLSLCGFAIANLPNILGNLKQLRYLDVSHTLIKQLPDSMCSLFNLQTLILSGCPPLSEYPKNLGKLRNLRYLDICGTNLPEPEMEQIVEVIRIRTQLEQMRETTLPEPALNSDVVVIGNSNMLGSSHR